MFMEVTGLKTRNGPDRNGGSWDNGATDSDEESDENSGDSDDSENSDTSEDEEDVSR